MNTTKEIGLAFLAALLVLFSSMINTRVTVILAITMLVAFSVYRYIYTHRGVRR